MVHSSAQVCKTDRDQRSRTFLAPLRITPFGTVAAFALFKRIPSLKFAIYRPIRHTQTSKTDKEVRDGKQPFCSEEDLPLLYPIHTVLSQELFASSEFFLHYYFQEERSLMCITRHRSFCKPAFFCRKIKELSCKFFSYH